METKLQKFLDITTDPYSSVRGAKDRLGRKVIGLFPMYIPEEIVHAAGLLPVQMWESNESITWGLSHVLSFNCALVKSVVDDGVKKKLDFIDGMILYDTCMQARTLPFILKRNIDIPYLEIIHITDEVTNPCSRNFQILNLNILKESLEKFTGGKVTSESLKESIKTYNKNRRMLRRIYELRREKPGLLKASELASIVWSSMLMLKEEHNELLEELLPVLEKKQMDPEEGVRVVLSGTNCMVPKIDILVILEDQGMLIVEDDFFVGPRYFANDAKEDVEPIEALADRILTRRPICPTKVDSEVNWGNQIIDMARKNDAQGVVFLLVKYCPPLLVYYPDVKRVIDKADLPELMVELDHEQISLESLKTRAQAFVESIGGK